MSNYEACVILTTTLAEPEIDATIQKLQESLTKGAAEILHVSKWGKRKLAHPIDKAAEGYYVVYFFKLENPAALKEFERVCRYDDNVVRQMVVKTPVKKKGVDVKQIIPEPGWLSEFNMKLRPAMARRGGGDRGGRRDRYEPRPDQAPAPQAPSSPPGEAAEPARAPSEEGASS